MNNKNIGVYIHIPYCNSKCPYCDFYSLADKSRSSEYVNAINVKVKNFTKEIFCKADTLYIGGGTPSVLPANELVSIIENVKKSFNCVPEEITIECNPSDCDYELFTSLYAAGANRLSFGMQSAVDSERRALGRRADRNQVKKAVGLAKKAGFKNISLDLMLGIPSQTAASLSDSIAFCADMGVQHISAYILKLEEGTFFYKNASKLNLPDDDAVADLYLQAVSELEKAGFKQYEISNFAKPGAESKHNLKYWRLEDYLGVGAAAHSCISAKRFYFPRDIENFINGAEPVSDGEAGDREEQIMLGLRLREGIKKELITKQALEQIPSLEKNGLIVSTPSRIALTPRGFLISNSIINALTE